MQEGHADLVRTRRCGELDVLQALVDGVDRWILLLVDGRIDTFGPRRCFWGTDLSALLRRNQCTYRQAVTMFTDEMKFLSKEDLEWVMGRGLAECLPWPVAPALAKKKAA